MNRIPWSRLWMIGLLLLLPAATTEAAWRATSAERWTPIRPQGQVERFQRVGPDGGLQSGSWTWLAPGDTLVFPLRGSGTVRVRTRALLPDGSERERAFRLGVVALDGQAHKLLRRTAPGGSWTLRPVAGTAGQRRVRVGERDTWTIETAGPGPLRLTLRESGTPPVLVRVLARGSLQRQVADRRARVARTRHRAPVRWRTQIAAASFGVDSNAYLAPSDSASSESAWFWPIEVGAGVRSARRGPFRWSLDYGFRGRFHDDPILDVRRHRLEAEQRWSARKEAGWSLRLRERLRAKNDTFFGRGAFEEFETSSVDPNVGTVALGDRFDWKEGRFELGLERRTRGPWTAAVDAWGMRRDYDEDYTGVPDIYSLDQNRYGVDLSVTRVLDEDTELHVNAGFALWDYDEKFARDATGTRISTEVTRLHRWPVELQWQKQPRYGWRGSVTAGLLVTRDRFEGYWDRQTWSLAGELGYRTPRDLRARLRVRRASTSYDISRVGNVPSGPIREKDSWKIGAAVAYPFRSHWNAEFEVAYDDYDNNSTTFAYSNLETVARVSWEY